MANHEYLVYLSDDSKLTQEEGAEVYKLLCILPYPANTNPINTKYINDNLTERQKSLLENKEDVVILEKLREINPKICILKFPKSMYQFYISSIFSSINLSKNHLEFRKKLAHINFLLFWQMPRLISLLDKEVDQFLPEYKTKIKEKSYHHDEFICYSQHREDQINDLHRIRRIFLLFKLVVFPILSLISYVSKSWHKKLTDYLDLANIPEDFLLVTFYLSDWITYIHYYFNKDYYYARCNSANNFPFKEKIWMDLNDALLSEVKHKNDEQYFKRLDFLAERWSRTSRIQLSENITADKHYNGHAESIISLIEKNAPLLAKIFALEIEFIKHASDKYILYRGSYLGPDDDYHYITQSQNGSKDISFGDGLFAGGGPRDYGAVAWNHISGWFLWRFLNNKQMFSQHLEPRTGYALILTKQQLSDLFLIPPLTNISKVFGCGEYFHPRSRVRDSELHKTLLNNSLIFSDNRKLISRNYASLTSRLLPEQALVKKYETADMYNNPQRYALSPMHKY